MNSTGKRQHAVIAGTGRAGTSFLVKFLGACGLDTGADTASWFLRARAGLEHRLDLYQDLPYVIKDPWLFSYCEQIDLSELRIDVLIVPVRDLMLAAESRVHQERIASSETILGCESNVQVVASTPGGVLYSLDVVDQARILAVGFYKLLFWGVANDLPIVMLDFPRMVEDIDYLIRSLWPWLGDHCTDEMARKAFAETSAATEIRIRSQPQPAGRTGVLGPGEPDPLALQNAALKERIQELANENKELKNKLQPN